MPRWPRPPTPWNIAGRDAHFTDVIEGGDSCREKRSNFGGVEFLGYANDSFRS
jgi:hypothetical protein